MVPARLLGQADVFAIARSADPEGIVITAHSTHTGESVEKDPPHDGGCEDILAMIHSEADPSLLSG